MTIYYFTILLIKMWTPRFIFKPEQVERACRQCWVATLSVEGRDSPAIVVQQSVCIGFITKKTRPLPNCIVNHSVGSGTYDSTAYMTYNAFQKMHQLHFENTTDLAAALL